MQRHVPAPAAARACGRQPGQRGEEQRAGGDGDPQGQRRAARGDRQHGQIEPVDLERRRYRREVGRPLRHRRAHQRKYQKHDTEAGGEPARRQRARARHALRVHPQRRKHRQRNADVQELQQREKTVVDRARQDEVADQLPAEHRHGVEPLGRGFDRVLREPVPGQHVAVDTRRIHQPQHHQPGDPRERAEAAIAVEEEVAQEVQQHRQHHRVGGVAMHAAHHATRVPLHVRQPLHRRIRRLDPGFVERIDVEAACDDHPEHEVADRAKVVERVQRLAEDAQEQRVDS